MPVRYASRNQDRALRSMLCVVAFAGLLAGTLTMAPASPADAQDTVTSKHHTYQIVPVVLGLEHPWGLAFLPNGDMLVTERPGRLRLVRDGKLVNDQVAGVPEVAATGQGGLLDVALHPGFADNRLVYLAYSKPGRQGATTAVIRGRLDGTRLADVEEIFEANAWGRGTRHFGSRLVFDRDGMLYVTVGDRGTMDRAQNRRDHAGTTLRLHDDGQIPKDNPFVGRDNALPEIYTYGNRNAQGMAIHPETGAVWQHEHGPRGGDEINLIRAGINYGWPVITHGIDYSGVKIGVGPEKEGMEQPLLHWTPSIAPSGMAFYTGDQFPQWRGDIFVGALAAQQMRRVRFEGTRVVEEEVLLAEFGERIRDVRDGPDGSIYFLTDSPEGGVFRLEPVD